MDACDMCYCDGKFYVSIRLGHGVALIFGPTLFLSTSSVRVTLDEISI